MNTKKLLSISVVVCSFLFLAGCSGNKAAVAPSSGTTTGTQNAQGTTKVDATRAQCLEMTSYGMKIALAQAKWDTATVTQYTQKWAALEQQFLAGNIEYQQACNKFMADSTFIQEVQKSLQVLK